MRLAEFDGPKFADDVARWVNSHRFGRQMVLRNTGVSCATLSRIVNHRDSIKDISTILSICSYLGLSMKDYVLVTR